MLDNQSLKNEKLLFVKNIKIIKRNYSRFHFNQNLTIQQSTGNLIKIQKGFLEIEIEISFIKNKKNSQESIFWFKS